MNETKINRNKKIYTIFQTNKLLLIYPQSRILKNCDDKFRN